MTRYMVISSDCHAGLPNEQYREWLDPQYRQAFDDSLAERQKLLELSSRGLLNEEFAEQWERENEEGLRGGWDAAERSYGGVEAIWTEMSCRVEAAFAAAGRGRCLRMLGRDDDAMQMFDVARERFVELGARRWIDAVDAASA